MTDDDTGGCGERAAPIEAAVRHALVINGQELTKNVRLVTR